MGSIVRYAEDTDIGNFSALWLEYLKEIHAYGSGVTASAQNLWTFLGFFRAYVNQTVAGVCVMAGEDGCLLWGVHPTPLDTDPPRIAQAWGTYLRAGVRGNGLAEEMRALARLRLRDLGVRQVHSQTLDANPHDAEKVGFRKIGNVVVYDVGEG